MTELLLPFLELIQQYGTLTVIVALAVVMFIMFSRTWTKQRDAQTEILENANTAQETLNKQFVKQEERIGKLEAQNTEQGKSIATLQSELAAARWELTNARAEIVDLQRKLEVMEADKTALAAERDQLRADFNHAKLRIEELEREVFKLQALLQAEKDVQEKVVSPILDLLQRSIPPAPPTGTTDKLNPDKVPDVDPAAKAPAPTPNTPQGE